MIHQPFTSFFKTKTGDYALELSELQFLHETVTQTYATRTRKSFSEVEKDLRRDIFMSAEEAKDHGIVDDADPDLYSTGLFAKDDEEEAPSWSSFEARTEFEYNS